MSIEILGLLYYAEQTEFRPAGKTFDPDFIRRHARLYDDLGFDGVLIGQNARSPDPLSIAAHVAANTQRLKFMIAHRPGFVAPTVAARMFATIDRLSAGRVAAHIIAGASDLETQQDCDFLTKPERYARAREYVDILRAIWTSGTPVDHHGAFYAFEKSFCEARPMQKPTIPIYWGGGSEAAIRFGAECADVYAMGPGTLKNTAAFVKSVRTAARPLGRAPEFLMTMRLIMAPTAEAAWKEAQAILDATVAFQRAGGAVGRAKGDIDRRIIAEAEAARGEDPCLWTELTVATEGRAATTALVGSPDQLCDALLNYYRAGISRFILTGFDPIRDTIEIGQELLPRLRAAAGRQSALVSHGS